MMMDPRLIKISLQHMSSMVQRLANIEASTGKTGRNAKNPNQVNIGQLPGASLPEISRHLDLYFSEFKWYRFWHIGRVKN
jgi:hypothetical protein